MRKLPIAACLVLLATLAAAPAKAKGPRKYVHETIGFSLRILGDWSETPVRVDFQARGVVSKFKAKSRGGDFATLDIMRFAPDLTETTPSGDKPEGGGDQPTPEEMIRRAMRQAAQAKDAEEALLNLLANRINAINRQANAFGRTPLEPIEELPKARKVKLGKAEGEVYFFEIEHENVNRWNFFMVAGIARKGQEEYLLLYASSWSQRKKYKAGFYSSIRSFRFPDETRGWEPPEEGEDEPDWDENSEFLDPEKRARVKKGLIGDWRALDTPHYMVLYHKKDRNLSKLVARRIEKLRSGLWEKDFPPVKPITAAMIIRLCPDKDTYHHYGGPRGTGGYWASGHDEFVFPSFSGKDRADGTTLGVLHHEGWHQYFHYALGGKPTPIAMNEGLAEYYFCAEPRGRGKFRIGDKHPMRHGVVKSAAGMGTLIPLSKFMRLTQREHYSKSSLCYSEGWALFYWLMKGTKNKEYQRIPYRLFEALAEGEASFDPRGGGSWRKAVDKALEGIDEEKLNEDFVKAVKKL